MRKKNKLMNRLYMKRYRLTRSHQKCTSQREKDNLRKKLQRKNMSPSEIKHLREKERLRKLKQRSSKPKKNSKLKLK